VTHDVKNLLQALRALCAAAEEAVPGDEAELVSMFKRQLPAVAARVTATLDKLRTPGGSAESSTLATEWWGALQRRYAANAVRFCEGVVDPAATVPGELFDSVAENLVANALRKPDVDGIHVEFDGATLQVWDDGAPVPPAVANDLFQRRVESSSGLGVGLYHCASYAARLGYRLALVSNEPGNVRFALSRA
jgi:signal transduction histidine kinase